MEKTAEKEIYKERHIISIENYQDPAIFEYLIAQSGGSGKDKQLYVATNIKTLKAHFLIRHGTVIETVHTLEKAIKRYNELP